ncbi:unnamed protein product [Penicillium camemberti]|uniref:Str. FM013 n=1 Tax=Penicillium camemberti (strain FM 013) TaxID=1429867 RepID=A0A0G4P484_PENC3|nr:unnamed protein product [Penicillium camemberti]
MVNHTNDTTPLIHLGISGYFRIHVFTHIIQSMSV